MVVPDRETPVVARGEKQDLPAEKVTEGLLL